MRINLIYGFQFQFLFIRSRERQAEVLIHKNSIDFFSVMACFIIPKTFIWFYLLIYQIIFFDK